MKTTTKRRQPPYDSSNSKPAPVRRSKEKRTSGVPIESVGVPDVGGKTPDKPPRRPSSSWASIDGHPIAELMRLREEAAAQVDRLIAFLDATDGDTDDEPEPDESNADEEPSLGSVASFEGRGDQEHWASGNTDDREGDPGYDDREPNVDDEEDDHGGDGAKEDDEPSLGWTVDGCVGTADLFAGVDYELGGLSWNDVDAGRRRRKARTAGGIAVAESVYVGPVKRLQGLTSRQRDLVQPRIVRGGGVSLR